MLYRRKTHNKQKKTTDLHDQLIKLSKQNQYLHTRLQYCEQQIEQLNTLKDKYKHKYRKLKTQTGYSQPSDEEFMGFKDQPSTRKHIFKDDNPYSLRKPTLTHKPDDVNLIIYKIRDGLCDFIEKITQVNQKLTNPPSKGNKKQISHKLDFLAEKLDDIVNLIKDKKNSLHQSYTNRMQSSRNSISMSHHDSVAPHKAKSTKKQSLQQYKETGSIMMENKSQQKKRERSFSEHHSCWKMLREIGIELRDWRVGMQSEGDRHEEDNI